MVTKSIPNLPFHSINNSILILVMMTQTHSNSNRKLTGRIVFPFDIHDEDEMLKERRSSVLSASLYIVIISDRGNEIERNSIQCIKRASKHRIGFKKIPLQ